MVAYVDKLLNTVPCRMYELAVGEDLCTIDLLTMMLSRENGGKAPCEHVWRCDI